MIDQKIAVMLRLSKMCSAASNRFYLLSFNKIYQYTPKPPIQINLRREFRKKRKLSVYPHSKMKIWKNCFSLISRARRSLMLNFILRLYSKKSLNLLNFSCRGRSDAQIRSKLEFQNFHLLFYFLFFEFSLKLSVKTKKKQKKKTKPRVLHIV